MRRRSAPRLYAVIDDRHGEARFKLLIGGTPSRLQAGSSRSIPRAHEVMTEREPRGASSCCEVGS